MKTKQSWIYYVSERGAGIVTPPLPALRSLKMAQKWLKDWGTLGVIHRFYRRLIKSNGELGKLQLVGKYKVLPTAPFGRKVLKV